MSLRVAILSLLCGIGATAASAQTPSFIYVRGAAGSANSMYAAYSLGPVALVFGAVINVRSGYREVIAGAVARVATGRQSTLLALTAADASDSRYLQFYVVPSLAVGSLALGGTLETYIPLQSAGTWDLDVNPVTALIEVAPRVRVGPSYKTAFAPGSLARHSAGLACKIVIPRGALTIEWLAGLRRAHGDVRAALEASF
jgi:hypothetical protein